MATIEERLAALEAREEIRDSDMAEIKRDVKLLLAKANQAKGGWAVIAAFSAVSGAVGGLLGIILKGKGMG